VFAVRARAIESTLVLPIALVGFAGFSIGFFAWLGYVVPLHNAVSDDLGLIGTPAAGIAVALALWQWYGQYFSRRTGITLARSLRYDAVTWAPFILLWLSLVLSPEAVHSSALVFVVCTGIFCVAKVVIAARFNQTVREVLVDFVATRAAIIVIAELAAVIIGQRPGQHAQESTHLLLNVWGRWDAVHYLDIATKGYEGTDMAFFPFLPLLIRGLGTLTGNHLVAGLLISNASFFFGLLFLYKLLEHEYDRHVARRAIFYVSIFPSAVFFSAVYTEALFFMLTVAAVYYMRGHRWLVAAVLGFFAAMTRVEGVLLAVPFAIEWWIQHRVTLREDAGELSRALLDLAPVILIPLGLGLYMVYLWVLRGDPLYFSHVQIYWHRHLAPPWASITHSFQLISKAKQPATIANQALELSFTFLMIGVLLGGWKRLRASFIAYFALSILVPMSTSSLMSMPRFALVLFPMFAILARWGERGWVNNVILAFSLPLLGLFTVLFTNWYWVS
jgi:hypothetical protein